jgi:hypothetical protein
MNSTKNAVDYATLTEGETPRSLVSLNSVKLSKCLCVRPLAGNNPQLGYFNHCTEHNPGSKSNKIVEDEFFSGRGRFYWYDIKLDSNVDFSAYQKFITEFLRRGETYDCLIHLSNVIYEHQYDKELVSLYDLPHLSQFIEVTTAIPQTIYFDLDDKRFDSTSLRELLEVDKLCRKLEGIPNISYFLINESVHTRNKDNSLNDVSTVLAVMNLNYKVQIAKEEEKMMQKINLKR